MMNKEELIAHIDTAMALCESTAEECIQELDDESGNEYWMARYEALKGIKEWIMQQDWWN